jgi:hypothetical protein
MKRNDLLSSFFLGHDGNNGEGKNELKRWE